MSPRCVLVAIAFLVISTQAEVRAQGAPTLRDDTPRSRPAVVPGDIVRVTAPDFSPERIEGRVTWLRPDTLVLEDRSGGVLSVPFESITRLEVSKRSTRGVGAVFGVLVGAVVGATLAGELSGGGSQFVNSLAAVAGAAVGAYGGYLAGNHVEKLLVGPRWKDVPLSRLQFGFAPSANGDLALFVSYKF